MTSPWIQRRAALKNLSSLLCEGRALKGKALLLEGIDIFSPPAFQTFSTRLRQQAPQYENARP